MATRKRVIPPLPYTVCFCKSGDKILMLHRNKVPNKNKWNGVGGKIEMGETPGMGVKREVREETGLDLDEAKNVRFGGIVSWKGIKESMKINGGTYIYIAEFSKKYVFSGEREFSEGTLVWKDIDWICDEKNFEVVDNIPKFLPKMLRGNKPKQYHCLYGKRKGMEGKLLKVTSYPLPKDFIL